MPLYPSAHEQEVNEQAVRVIDGLGGVNATARFFEIEPSSVSEWRTAGVPQARLRHLRDVRPDLVPPEARIPASFQPARWRGTLPFDAAGSTGISFDLEDGSTVRLRLDARSVKDVRETLAGGYSNSLGSTQSQTKPLNPSAPKSVPSEGENV